MSTPLAVFGKAAFVLLLSQLALPSGLPAQPTTPPQAAAFSPGEPIPFDSVVRTGTLANGLRYYLRENAQPANRISLRLAVKAGSIHEADDQQGLAHVLEHMAFNGSTHFPPGALVAYFESVGAGLGPHVNAYTSFDETVYMLDVPADQPEVVTKALTALADFAGGLTLDPEQVELERGVVIEEWRGRLGAASRIRDAQLPVLYHQSRYAERLPIGRPDVIRTAPVERLRAFYDQWYRPDRIALVVVGDFRVGAMEAEVRTLFGTLAARAPASPRLMAAVPLHDDLLVSVVSDPEVTQSSVQLIRKYPNGGDTTVGDYRRRLVENLVERILNERFADLARRPDAAFLSAAAGGGALSLDVDTFSLTARVAEGELSAGATALAVEARRVGEFGFNSAELDRAKRSLLARYDRAHSERNKTDSSSFAREYVSHFLVAEPSPGIEYEYRLVESVLPEVTLEEVSALARRRLTEGSRVILAVSPAKDGLTTPSEATLRAALDAADAVALTPWSDPNTPLALMDRPPAAGAVISRRELPDIGVTVLGFDNGVEAWLKPTDFKNEQLLFTMYAMGGTSVASEDDYIEASLTSSYIGLSGLGGFEELELERLLAGKRASATPFISHSTHGISGSASPAELETALQLLYLTFTAPNDDPEAFALLKRRLHGFLANRDQSPAEVFRDRIAEINASGHYTSRPLRSEDVDRLEGQAMMRFYRARFSNAADFTLFMVGSFQLDAVEPLLVRYVGGLPAAGERSRAFKQLGVQFPAAIEQVWVEKGREPRSQTVISFFANPSTDPREQEKVIAATQVLETMLRDVLREELGQTYTVSVGLVQSPPQEDGGYIRVSFGAAPENIQAMTDRVLAEIKRLQQEGPSEELTSRAREAARRSYETALSQNSYWLGRLQTVHMLGRDPREIMTRTERIRAVTTSAVQQAFRDYFPLDRHTIVTLVPEGSKTP